MRRFGLVGVALVLFASSASAQHVLQVTTFPQGRGKMTIIEPVRLPTLDQLSQQPPGHGAPQCAPACGPCYPLCCMLPDQPALLYRLSVMNALHTTGIGGAVTGPPKLDELPRPAVVDDKKVEERKVDKAAVRESPLPATMITLDATDWYCGRGFTDDCGRRWCLLKGCALPNPLPHMRGWLLESDGKKLYFVHETGNIYTRLIVPTLP